MSFLSAEDCDAYSSVNVRQRAAKLAARKPGILPRRSDFDLNPELLPEAEAERPKLRPAAVLVPVIDRGGETQLLFTQRTAHLSAHAGQVSFPGGKIDESDQGPVAAALREAEEEIGLGPQYVDVLGELDSYQTGTGFHIYPVLAMVSGDVSFQCNAQEVSEYFEVPLRFLMAPENYQKHLKHWRGKPRAFYAISYGKRYIWGATAGIVRNLYERLYSDD